MKTVHLVFNAHIDPIWLWPWASGLDAVLNTCETMCNLLDRNPEITFTRGEAWCYDQIERIDPALFRRIQAHVRAGRWEIVGGWWIQPDCNLPGVEGFRKQIELGRDYFRSRFGQFPRIGYNVDSFGHASVLPRIMREFGQTHYVMMRPQEHEKKLPARLFRWQGETGGPSVTTFRIAGGYNNASNTAEMNKEMFEKAVTELPPGVDDTMCFIGFGDHGGGPSQQMIDWLRANPEPLPGVRLMFSSPARFFRAVAKHEARLPLVEGDLQHHAIGCYSVYRQVKTEVRRAENLLLQAGEALKADRVLAKETVPQMDSAWKRTCFHHFHDTMGGTCVPSAYPFVFDQLGEACSTGEEIIATALRRKLAGMKPHAEQRIVLQNNSGAAWHDFVEHEPWLDVVKAEEEWTVRDERGRFVPHQRVLHEAVVTWGTPRLLFKLAVAPGERRVLRIAKKSDTREKWTAKPRSKISGGKLKVGRDSWPLPVLQLIEDKTDTWSHGIRAFAGPVKSEAKWGKPELIESGPLLEAWWMDGRIGRSTLGAEWRVYAGEPFFELRLRVAFAEQQRVLRLEWKPGPLAATREDGVPGTGLRRPNDGNEHPVRDRTLLELQGGGRAGAVFPGAFSLSATRAALRLTLLRSPQLAQHDPPVTKRFHRARWSDQGDHDFVFRFYPRHATAAQLDRDALALQRSPAMASITRGMPAKRA